MNNKEIKVCKYLSKAYYDKVIINSYMDELEYIASKILTTNKFFDNDKVQGGKLRSNEDLVSKFIDYKELISKNVEKLSKEVEHIISIINRVEDPRYNAILVMRYLRHESWETIAENISYDRRWVYRLHNKAIREIIKMRVI